ncbi:MAG: hypothetical protein ACXU8W_03520 [Caulobacteraceae bacterium]
MMIVAAFGLLAIAPATASAQKIDKNGRCHDAAGTFAKDEVCKGASSSKGSSATAADPNGPYKLDAKGKCHDVKGKMAAKAKCAA